MSATQTSKKPQKLLDLERFASETIGDGKSPNLFFVTDNGVVVTITRNFGNALKEWRTLAARYPKRECALEDRKFGVIADVSPESDDDGARLVVRNSLGDFCRFHEQYKAEASL